jgi:hypothetical protein
MNNVVQSRAVEPYMEQVEAIGLVKMDILAQGGLAVMRDAKKMITDRGIEVDLKALEPWDDPEVWQMIAAGEARGLDFRSPDVNRVQESFFPGRQRFALDIVAAAGQETGAAALLQQPLLQGGIQIDNIAAAAAPGVPTTGRPYALMTGSSPYTQGLQVSFGVGCHSGLQAKDFPAKAIFVTGRPRSAHKFYWPREHRCALGHIIGFCDCGFQVVDVGRCFLDHVLGRGLVHEEMGRILRRIEYWAPGFD